MSKNLIRKGLAFGAIVALGSTVLAGAPAQAAGNGLTGYVTLAANGGTYTNVLTTDTLNLKANFSPAVNEVSGRYLKFLVTDANSTSRVDATRTDSASATLGAADASAAIATNRLVVTETNAATNTLVSGTTFVGFGATDATDAAKLNDQIFTGLSGDSTADRALTGTDGNVVDTGVTYEATAGKMSRAGLVATSLGKSLQDGYALADSIAGTATTNGRTSTGSYVVASNIYQAGSDVVLRLASNSADAQTHVVTAWIDIDGDNAIDDNEYASPDVTVKFLKPTDVTPTLTIDPVGINDISVTSRVSFSPELNMIQTSNVKVSTTRQGFAESFVATSAGVGARNIADASQVGTTSTRASTIGLYNDSTDATWDTAEVLAAVTDGTTAKVGNIVTITSASHLAVVGDIVKITSANAPFNNGYYVVKTAAAGSFTLDAGAGENAETDWDYQIVGKAAIAGTYGAQVSLGGVLIGTAVYQSTGTTSVDALSNEITVANGVSEAGSVRVGFTSDITITSEALKADTSAAASVPVLVTATAVSTAGTILVNGIKAAANGTWNLTTDAAGNIALKVSNSSAKANESITLQVKTQGQTSTTTLTWAAAVYKLYDLNVRDAWLSNRTVETGGSYTFDLALLDQWKAAPTVGSYRVLVTQTGQTQSAQYVDMTSGSAKVTVTDNKIGTGGFVDVQADIEYKAVTDTSYSTYASGDSDWDATYNSAGVNGDDIVRVHVIKDQNDAIVLGATATTTYQFNGTGVTSDFSAPLAAKATVAQNRNSAQATQPSYANAVVVHGQVQNSVTAVGRKGAVVTVSGAANILFSVGGLDSLGSITTIADENGNFSVKAFSNVAQKDAVLTFTTSDGASKTQKVTFEKAGTTAGAAITINAPLAVPSGRTLPVTVKLTDKYGNAVDTDGTDGNGAIKVTVTGGLGWSTTIAAQTDENGEITFQQILAPEDKGTLTITAKYDSNGFDVTDVAGTTTSLTVTQSTVVGAAAAVTSSVAGIKGFVAVTVRNASGKAVTVTVNGRVLTPRAPNVAAQLYRFRATAGKTTVVVKVDGVTVASRTVTVK